MKRKAHFTIKCFVFIIILLYTVSLTNKILIPKYYYNNLWPTTSTFAGFYKMEKGILVLGPFQGKPACIEIAVGRGVCGTAVAEDKTRLVYDVHEFPGHIACDAASNSEIVVPIHVNGEIWGVLDIDSPNVGRFTEEDKEGLERFVKVLEQVL